MPHAPHHPCVAAPQPLRHASTLVRARAVGCSLRTTAPARPRLSARPHRALAMLRCGGCTVEFGAMEGTVRQGLGVGE